MPECQSRRFPSNLNAGNARDNRPCIFLCLTGERERGKSARVTLNPIKGVEVRTRSERRGEQREAFASNAP